MESNVIDHNIEISNEGINYFGNFKYALKKGVVPSLSDNDIEEGTNTLEHQQAMNAFETGFGYLLHSYNPPDDANLFYSSIRMHLLVLLMEETVSPFLWMQLNISEKLHS